MQAGESVHVFVNQEEVVLAGTLQDEEEQARFRALAAQLLAETDAVERQPGTYADPQKAGVAAMIAEKHRNIGPQV